MNDKNQQKADSDLLTALFYVLNELEKNDVSYALLHPGSKALPEVRSDIDIVLDASPELVLLPVLKKMQTEHDVKLVQAMHYDVPYGYYYVIQIPSDDGYCYLQLDCLYDPYGINRYHLDSIFLLNNRCKYNNYYRASQLSETLYLLIKRTLKRNACCSNTEALALSVNELGDVLTPDLHKWFGKRITKKILELSSVKKYEELSKLLNNSYWQVEKRFIIRNPLTYLHKQVATSLRKIRRFFKPTGMFVVLIGPDGCGKTTISGNLRRNMARSFRSVSRFHWRPKLLPKLGRSNSLTQDVKNEAELLPAPPEKPKYSPTVSLIRFIYYFTDFVLGYWLVIYPRRARSTLIVGERYFADILVHPARYGFNLPHWIMRAFSVMVPKPDAIILLSGDAQRIYERKPELDVQTITNQLAKYTQEIMHWGNHYIADTNETADEVLRQVECYLGDLMQQRTLKTRHTTLLAFPRFGRTRILISPDIDNKNLARLYSPASTLGKLSMMPLKIPSWVFRLLVSKPCKTAFYGDFPRIQADSIIKQYFNGFDKLSISYYMGNGGPRSKITAQVSHRGNVIAYVKIARTENTKALLDNEYQSLHLVRGKLDGSVPNPLELYSHAGLMYMFTSVPNDTYTASKYTLTESHLKLARTIFKYNATNCSIDEYLDAHDLESRIKSIRFNEFSTQSGMIAKQGLRYVKQHFQHKSISIGRKHGDFCPWNILINNKGRLYIFDWEYSEENHSALSDVLHFVRSCCHFVWHYAPQRTAESMLTNNAIRNLASNLDIKLQDIPAYAVIYLLHEILRHCETHLCDKEKQVNDQQQINQINYLTQCLYSIVNIAKRGVIPRRICVAAYACEPDKGSEPGVGWNWVKLIAQNNDVWVFTKYNNKGPVEEYLSKHPDPNLNFVFVDLPRWLTFWKKGQRGVRTYYYLWQFFALRKARKLHKTVDFSFAHHVTFVNDWLWSFVAMLPVPFIWGPIGSHPKIPKQLLPHNKALFKEMARLSIQRGMRVFDPLYWITVIRASRILVINKEIAKQFPIRLLGRNKCTVETAIAHENTLKPGSYPKPDKFNVLYVGRFHHTKCPHLVLESFAKAQNDMPEACLTLVGRGPEEAALRELAKGIGIDGDTIFKPWSSHADILQLMAESSVFLFPSTEGGGMVVIEALSLGLPVVCLDYGGPGSIVTDSTGSLVKIAGKHQVINDLAKALVDYYLHPEKLEAYSLNAISYAETRLTWATKLKRIENIYETLQKSRSWCDCKQYE